MKPFAGLPMDCKQLKKWIVTHFQVVITIFFYSKEFENPWFSLVYFDPAVSHLGLSHCVLGGGKVGSSMVQINKQCTRRE